MELLDEWCLCAHQWQYHKALGREDPESQPVLQSREGREVLEKQVMSTSKGLMMLEIRLPDKAEPVQDSLEPATDLEVSQIN